MDARTFHLGETVDPTTHDRSGTPIQVKSSDLTTHGVIVGMTGSGKTGLGVALLEEALGGGVPVIAFDPKGDLTNLLLTFPALDAASFAPWVDPSAAEQAGQSVEDFAAAQADTWRNGLASWGIDSTQIQALRDTAAFTIFTPGSSSGVPLNLVGSLAAPVGADAETTADEIEGYVSGLLGLVGVQADPLASREHILLSNLVAHGWANGQNLDLPTLVAQVAQPPLRKLGVFEIDQFFPPNDRNALAMKLNGLLASPSFAAWGMGAPLDIDLLVRAADGRPRAAIICTAHLSEDERQFVTSLVLGKLITWMRRQTGTGDLRTLVYLDEVAGYCPPTAQPPAKKPILTLLKQARAFGVGMVLATQNPVDVDYKVLSNAGTWLIGRLQTEQDRSRLLDGLSSATGGVDVAAVGATIAGLAKREFVLRRVGTEQPVVLTSRWAMSYLRGPLTREQIAGLMADAPERTAEPTALAPPVATPASPATAATPVATEAVAAAPLAPAASPPDAAPVPEAAPAVTTVPPVPVASLAADESPVAPKVADGIAVRWVDPAAPWAPTVGATAGTRYEAAAVARVQLLFDDTKLALRSTEEWEAVLHPLGVFVDPAAAQAVDYDDRDLLLEAPAGAVYRLTDAPIATKAFWTGLQRDLVAHLVASRTVELWQNRSLKLVSRPGESQEDFAARAATAASEAADAEAAKLRGKYETKLRAQQGRIDAAHDRAEVAAAQAKAQKSSAMLSAAGSLLGGFLGGRRSTGSLVRSAGTAASRASRTGASSARTEAAANKAEAAEAELLALNDELADELGEIHERWTAAATEVEEVTVPLERSDVTVSQIVLAWLPVG